MLSGSWRIFNRSWRYLGQHLKWSWTDFGEILERSWTDLGESTHHLQQILENLEQILEIPWADLEVILDRFWRDLKRMLERYWTDVGEILDRSWRNFGPSTFQPLDLRKFWIFDKPLRNRYIVSLNQLVYGDVSNLWMFTRLVTPDSYKYLDFFIRSLLHNFTSTSSKYFLPQIMADETGKKLTT